MRIVFVDNLLFEQAEGIRRYVHQPHLGLISLIAVAEGGGHEGLLFDPKAEIARGNLHLDESLYRQAAAQILALEPDVVGMTSLGCNFICTAKIAAYLKRSRPDLPILLGGPHATVLDRDILSAFSQFDVIARSEAEFTLLPLLDALPTRALPKVPGITYRRKGVLWQNPGEPNIADLDSLPFPAYHSYPVSELGLRSLRVDAGRGCPFGCTFCSTASFFGRKFRLKSTNRLVSELDRLSATYGVKEFALTHDLFTVNRNKVLEFCEAVEGRGYTWRCSARMDCVDDELLEHMSRAGCASIYYGIEAGSMRMQTISKKHLDLALFDPMLEATQSRGMSSTISFITGYPEENAADQAATLDLIGACFSRTTAPLNVQLHLLTPEPGTELLQTYRGRIAYDGHVSDFNFPTLEPDDDLVISGHPDVFINHHFFPSVTPRRRHILVTTAYQSLYALGFPLMRHILSMHDNRLSTFMDALDVWATHAEAPTACEPPVLQTFFDHVYGVDHYLPGLVRYMSTASELRRRAINDRPLQTRSFATKGGSTAYRLARNVAVVRDVPECPRILDYMVAHVGPIPESMLTSRHHFLLQVPTTATDEVRNFALSDSAARLLVRFTDTRDWALERRRFARDTGLPAPPAAFIRTLAARGFLEAGILQPYSAPHGTAIVECA